MELRSLRDPRSSRVTTVRTAADLLPLGSGALPGCATSRWTDKLGVCRSSRKLAGVRGSLVTADQAVASRYASAPDRPLDLVDPRRFAHPTT
jgi:hypothetical protein